MTKINVLLAGLCLAACSGHESENKDEGNAAGTADAYEARHVSGVYLLSTDYRYREPCNYLPEEFIRNLFQLDEKVELAKVSELNSCELRWQSNKIGFYLESDRPFESTFRSEHFFNSLFEPEANKAADLNVSPKPTIFGPQPQGTNAEVSADTEGPTPEQDSIRGGDPASPLGGITKPSPPIAAPAQNTATGEAVTEVGDKAIWEPGKKSLHVLFNNHVFSGRTDVIFCDNRPGKDDICATR